MARCQWCRSQVLCIVCRVSSPYIFLYTHHAYHPCVYSVMSCLYCLWDILDDLVFRKVHESDASKFAKMCGGCMSSRVWGALWFMISLIFFVAGILIGLAAFKGKGRKIQCSVIHFSLLTCFLLHKVINNNNSKIQVSKWILRNKQAYSILLFTFFPSSSFTATIIVTFIPSPSALTLYILFTLLSYCHHVLF